MPASTPMAPVTPASASSVLDVREPDPLPVAGSTRLICPGCVPVRSIPSTVFTGVNVVGAVEVDAGVLVSLSGVGVCVFGGLVLLGVAVFVAVSTGVEVVVFCGVLVAVTLAVAVSTGVGVLVGVYVFGVCVTPGVPVAISSVGVCVTSGVRVAPAVLVVTTVRVPAPAVPVTGAPASTRGTDPPGTPAAWVRTAAASRKTVATAAAADRRRA
jgi:hypothetical protein